ncbi:hypothetical protein [Pararhodospirillum photometricum]|uniref:Uncharacterized protein n=1 Tax=Pararhodospirillum photometricum DSM 122 TaxID=1150469 RepID=H6SLK4_PARPM|nr:hypothetical protein [Pararhodospirillum photometricum]CCG08869.1 Putative uncharacterized protein [Pararhodospirillum photometricum DSM 122]
MSAAPESRTHGHPRPPLSPLEEVNTLFGLLAKAFSLEAEALARALEDGRLTLVPATDAKGERHVVASLTDPSGTHTVRVYRDALYHETPPEAGAA